MIVPRYYQREAVGSVFNFFDQKNAERITNAHPIVAMPTGTGKSIVIGGICIRALHTYPKTRIIGATHVKELIDQNALKLQEMWPQAPIGIYSAGLKRRETAHPIVFGGIASIVNRVEEFGHRDLFLVDECHLVSPKQGTMYQRAFEELKKINPYIKMIGFSATYWRMGQGLLTEGNNLFTNVCYNLCTPEAWKRLISEGHLVPPVTKKTQTELNVSNVSINNGEFVVDQLQAAVDTDDANYSAVKEMCELGTNRGCWLVFCSGIEHSEHVSTMLQKFGISSVAMHSKNTSEQNAAYLKAWKSGEIRAVCSMNKLTTGVDNPAIDMIAMLRPSMSTGLWVQMLGRGTRPCPEIGKANCLVLDFARNTERLGPIDDPYIPQPRKKRTPGDVPIKLCEYCGTYNHISATKCVECGMDFPERELQIEQTASVKELLSTPPAAPIVEHFNVDRVYYLPHMKPGAPSSLRVDYQCGIQTFSEWVCFEHKGLPQHRAHEWWRMRCTEIGIDGKQLQPPATVTEALQTIARIVRVPNRIRVWMNSTKGFPEILNPEFL